MPLDAVDLNATDGSNANNANNANNAYSDERERMPHSRLSDARQPESTSDEQT